MIKKSEELFEFLQKKNVIIVLDSSSILDVYEYDSNTSNKLLSLYEQYAEKIWIPKQVKDEVQARNYVVRNTRKTTIKNFPKNIKHNIQNFKISVDKNLKNLLKFKYPEIEEINNFFDEKIKELETRISNYTANENENLKNNEKDDILEFIYKIDGYKGIGKGFDTYEKLNIYMEGEIRYKMNIPPGFEDVNKYKKDKEKENKKDTMNKKNMGNYESQYGDLVIWKEILDHSKTGKYSILFITSDSKGDWWDLGIDNCIENTNPKLIEEFKKITNLSGNELEMLETGSFYSLHLDFSDKTYDEIMDHISTDYQLNRFQKFKNIIEISQINDELKEKLELESKFMDANFSEFIQTPILNVEVLEVIETFIPDIDVLNEGDYLELTSELQSCCAVAVETEFPEKYNFNIYIDYSVRLFIPILEESEIEHDKGELDENSYLDFKNIEIEYEFFNIDNVINTYSPYDGDYDIYNLCEKCNKRVGIYTTGENELICDSCSTEMDYCSKCGKFFEKGSLAGSLCFSCDN